MLKGAAMDILDLRTVLAIGAAGSYNQAAKTLGISHQAVSKTMRRIQRQTKKPLFEYNRGRMTPTDFGTEFLRDAETLYQSFAEFEQRYASLPSCAADGQALNVALVTGGAAGLPEGFFDTYTQHHPHVTLVIEEMNSERVLSTLEAGEFDIGILGTHPQLVQGFDAKAIVRMGVWLLVPEGHPLARASQDRGIPHVGLEALDGLPMVTAGSTNHLPRFVMDKCRQAGIAPNVIATATDGEFMRRISRERGAVCFAFDPRIRKPPAGNLAVRLDFPGSDEFGTYAIRKKGDKHSPAALAFWDEQLPLIGE